MDSGCSAVKRLLVGSPLIRDDWDAFGFDVALEVLESPYRVLGQPDLDFIDRIDGLRDTTS